jgi:outer membrane protein TolC
MEQLSMRQSMKYATLVLALVSLAASAGSAAAQAGAAPVRGLSIDEAVQLALEQNLGIAAERFNPQIQDTAIAQAQSYWLPTVTTSLQNVNQDNPATNALAGGQTISDHRFTTQLGIAQTLKYGTNYSLSWNSLRQTTNNFFTNYNPLFNAGLAFNATQPLLRNRTIDTYRQQLEVSRKQRDASDVSLRATVVTTTRNVKNAYWDLAYARDNLRAQQQSLDLAKRSLADNEKRVQIGTMAPIDIVEAQSEVARNDEGVIVAEAAIKQAEDRLRALIFDPKVPDFWTMGIEPTDTMPFQAYAVDVDGAVRRALANRTDVQLAQNQIEQTEVNLKFFRSQVLPEVNANVAYQANAVGGSVLQPITSFPPTATERSVLSQRGFGSVLGDVFTSEFPAWTFGVSISYPVGDNTQKTNLSRATLQYQQSLTQLRNIELQVATQIRDSARSVQTNQKRVDSARAARDLAEQRLAAEEKKFAAGIQTSFFVFQAQRDLAQARTNEVRAIADYNKSIVDFEALQEASVVGTNAATVVGTLQTTGR